MLVAGCWGAPKAPLPKRPPVAGVDPPSGFAAPKFSAGVVEEAPKVVELGVDPNRDLLAVLPNEKKSLVYTVY